jgi:hypothetical protein
LEVGSGAPPPGTDSGGRWNPQNRTCSFVEIKGPGDSLSDRQRAWGEKLVAAGANMVVCHVVYANSAASARADGFVMERDLEAEVEAGMEAIEVAERDAVIVVLDDD